MRGLNLFPQGNANSYAIQGRVRLSGTERQTLAEIGKKLGQQVLEEKAHVVKPDTTSLGGTVHTPPRATNGYVCQSKTVPNNV
jgi:hypothetical protein